MLHLDPGVLLPQERPGVVLVDRVVERHRAEVAHRLGRGEGQPVAVDLDHAQAEEDRRLAVAELDLERPLQLALGAER